jgi:diguanylate cyclase (GGDEF)-like protein/PAS domain S-box-containing protein
MRVSGLALRYTAWLLAVTVPVLILPAIYFYIASGDATDRLTMQAEDQAVVESRLALQQRADDIARASAVYLSNQSGKTGAIEFGLAQLFPTDTQGAIEVVGADGKSVASTGSKPVSSAIEGQSHVSSGPLAGSLVTVSLRLDAGIARAAASDRVAGAVAGELSRLLKKTFFLALAVLLATMAVVWLPVRRTAAALAKATGRLWMIGATGSETSDGVAGSGIEELGEAVAGAERALRDLSVSRAFLDHVLDSIQDAVLVVTNTGKIRRVNDAACKMLGLSPGQIKGLSLKTLTPDTETGFFSTDGELKSVGESSLSASGGRQISVAFSSAPLQAEDGSREGDVVVLRDLSDEEKSRKRIRYLTRYDALTRVANRIQFQHKLQQAIARAKRNDIKIALLYIDLDRFKDINDTYGHPVGDRSLEIMARRLVDATDPGTLIGRLAGDEFAILLEGLPADQDLHPSLAATARTLLDRIATEFYVERQEIYTTASIGIAVCPDDADNVIDLIRNADAAMYHAKQNSGNTYGFYSAEMNANAVDRLMMKNELRRAMERNEFQVVYQPKIDLRDGRVTGAEALLRWRHPKRGEVPPAVFIPLAEDSSLIFEIGEWVLNKVCADYVQWQTRLAWPGRVAVNLSLRQLRQRDFIERIEQAFERHRLTPSCIELEITESTLMSDGEKTLRMLDRLYQLGLHLSIDDFGTGYSSLSALQDFPIGTLKIDQSFVQDAASEPDRGAIVTTIISMGKTLKMDVVAEGVETEEQLEFLRRHDCTYAQGHLFGEPVDADTYLAMLVDQQRGKRRLAALFA